jgi:hypothetical protein
MTCVDFKGHRVTAMALLPIKSCTLVYGSSDVGKSVHCSDVEAQVVTKRLCMKLNLVPHRVLGVEFLGPADLEIHCGMDRRLYVVDLGRLFPPQGQFGKVVSKSCVWIEKLRPEFVSCYK